jgi:hypothetical protein
VLVGHRGGGGEVVERAAVDVAGLQADDRRPRRAGGEDPPELRHVDRPLAVGGHRLDDPGAEAQQAQRPVDRRVALGAGHHPHRRSAGEAVGLDVPPGPAQDVVAGRGERDRVGPLPTGDEPEGRAGRQAEQLRQPRPGHLLDHRRARRRRRVERRLVPAGGQHFGRRRRVERPADDEPEVAGPGGGHQRRLHRVGQLVDDRGRRGRIVGQRAEPGPEPVEVDVARVDRPLAGLLTVIGGARRGVHQEVT